MPTPAVPASPADERRVTKPEGRIKMAGIQVRSDDLEPTTGIHSVAILFRIMAGLLLLLMVVQVALGLTSAVEISYGVLFAEAIRLVIFAGLLWGAGDVADLMIKAFHDLRASRILLARISYRVNELTTRAEPLLGEPAPRRDDQNTT
jgi:uncharacterized membrane protein YciS (DUF1049 family)